MKSIRFYITERCNANCRNCFNKDERGGSQMDIDKFEELCNFFSENRYQLLKIMGGEPTLHPQFKNIMLIAQKYFQQVNLFTNGMSDSLLEFQPRETDGIVYNFKFNRALNNNKLLLNKQGKRSFEIQVTKETNCEKLITDLMRIYKMSNYTIYLNLTLDCTTDIFTEKSTVIPMYEYIWNKCNEIGFEMRQDHIVPLCYATGSQIRIPQGGAMCNIECAGLIDASYNIRFCNQYSSILSNLYLPTGKLLDIHTYENILSEYFNHIQEKTKAKGCDNCPMYNKYCNGGCFAAKDNINVSWK